MAKTRQEVIEQEYPKLDLRSGMTLIDTRIGDKVEVVGLSYDSVVVETQGGETIHIGPPEECTYLKFEPTN